MYVVVFDEWEMPAVLDERNAGPRGQAGARHDGAEKRQ